MFSVGISDVGGVEGEVKQETPDEYDRIYHRRNVAGNLHSILKEHLLFDKNLNVKGFEAIDFYARTDFSYITLCSVNESGERSIGGFG